HLPTTIARLGAATAAVVAAPAALVTLMPAPTPSASAAARIAEGRGRSAIAARSSSRASGCEQDFSKRWGLFMALRWGQMRGDPGFEAGARASQARCRRTERNLQRSRDLGQREAFELVEHEHLALFGSKACERIVEPAAALGVLEQALRIAAARALLVERVRRFFQIARLAPARI